MCTPAPTPIVRQYEATRVGGSVGARHGPPVASRGASPPGEAYLLGGALGRASPVPRAPLSRPVERVALLRARDHRLDLPPIRVGWVLLRIQLLEPRRIAGNSRSMNFMKCVRVPSCRYMTLHPTKRAPWSAMALIVRSTFDREDEKPGTIGAISTPALTPASTSSRTARSR